MTQLRVVAAEERQGHRPVRLVDPQDQGHGDAAAITELLLEVARPLRLPISPRRRATAGTSRRSARNRRAPLAPNYFNMRKVSIYGGSNEIQKNIIAKAIWGSELAPLSAIIYI